MRRILAYLLIFLGACWGINRWYAAAYYPVVSPTPSGVAGVVGRLPWYKNHRDDFNLLFLGDSRTYCGVHTGLIDPQLGTTSLNLAQFSHWFATQYPMIRDLVSIIPAETVVVWSIGHQNFYPSAAVQRVYPVGWMDALRLYAWGVKTPGIADNALYYSKATFLIADRGEARKHFLDFIANRGGARSQVRDSFRPRISPPDPEPVVSTQKIDSRAAGPFEFAWRNDQWVIDPRIETYNTTSADGKINSAMLFTKRGSYYRIELDPAFFREKQREMQPQPYSDRDAALWRLPPPDPAFWRLFEEMLRLFREHKIHLIVNEMEEAPFIYAHPLIRESYRKFMRETVAARVRDFGFPYVHVDFDQLSNEDYFDYNHLNSRGVAKFTPMLVEQLRPLLPRRTESSP